MNKILVSVAIISLLIAFIGIIYFHESNNIPNSEQVYQGPVRPTDNESYFRKTGITKPLGDNNA